MGDFRSELGQGSWPGSGRAAAWHALGRSAAHRGRLSRRRPVEDSGYGQLRRSGRAGLHRREPPAAVLRPRREPVDVVQAPLQSALLSSDLLLGVFPDASRRPALGRSDYAPAELGSQEHSYGHGSCRRSVVGLLAGREPPVGLCQPPKAESGRSGLAGTARIRRRTPLDSVPSGGRRVSPRLASQRTGRCALHPQLPRRAWRGIAAYRAGRLAPPYRIIARRGWHGRWLSAGVLPVHDRRCRDGLRSVDRPPGGRHGFLERHDPEASRHVPLPGAFLNAVRLRAKSGQPVRPPQPDLHASQLSDRAVLHPGPSALPASRQP